MIDVMVQLTAHHRGWFEFHICPHDDVTKPITNNCLKKHLLPEVETGRTKFYVGNDFPQKLFNFTLQLPSDMVCEQCVLRWMYNTGKLIFFIGA